MRQCSQCSSSPEAWSSQTAPPGRCSECGRPFDIQGMPILDESVTCLVHDPIRASCPHPAADVKGTPEPAASWLPGTPGDSA